MRQLLVMHMPDAQGFLTVEGKDARYLKQVLRLKPDDVVAVRLPSGQLENMYVVSFSTSSCLLQCCSAKSKVDFDAVHRGVSSDLIASQKHLLSRNNTIVGYGSEIWLFQAMLKSQKMDTVIRQAVEIGVSRIVPVVTHFSVAEGSGSGRQDRWNRIVKEARQQSGSPVNTHVEKPLALAQSLELRSKWLDEQKVSASELCQLVLTEDAGVANMLPGLEKKTLRGYLEQKPLLVVLFVGCEGGIALDELSKLYQDGFVPIHFYTNILRAETAAVYGLSAIQNLLTESE